MRAAYVFVLAAGLGLAAFARDTLDIWVNATVLPPLQVETSVEVLDRNGALLRAYTVADGRWRLGVDLSQVDPSYIGALLAYDGQLIDDARLVVLNAVDAQARGATVLTRCKCTSARRGAQGWTATLQPLGGAPVTVNAPEPALSVTSPAAALVVTEAMSIAPLLEPELPPEMDTPVSPVTVPS